jgi:hypothetical protein
MAAYLSRHSSGLHRHTSLGAVTEAAASYRETIHAAIRATTSCSIPL